MIAASAPAADGCPAPVGFRADELREGILEIPGGIDLFHGGRIADLRIAWRLAGAARAPVVAALGGISAHRTVYSGPASERGWWDGLVGPGHALDSSRFRVLGCDFLGGSGRTTGPIPLEGGFASVSTYDQAELLARVLNHLDIPRLHAIVGASYGGMVGLAFAERFAGRVSRLLVISAADRTHPLATAWRSIQRAIVRRALASGEGVAGLELARALAMATYRSGEEFAARFRSPATRDAAGTFVFPVEEYLFARGADYAAHYRPEAFLCLSESIDLHTVDADRIRTPTTLVGIRQDQLVPFSDLRTLCTRLGPAARLVELSSIFGHDAFLKESAQLAPVFESTLETPP